MEVQHHLPKKLQQPLGALSQRKRPELDAPVQPRVEVAQDGAVPVALLAFAVRVMVIPSSAGVAPIFFAVAVVAKTHLLAMEPVLAVQEPDEGVEVRTPARGRVHRRPRAPGQEAQARVVAILLDRRARLPRKPPVLGDDLEDGRGDVVGRVGRDVASISRRKGGVFCPFVGELIRWCAHGLAACSCRL